MTEENGCQRIRTQKAGHPRAQPEPPAVESSNEKPAKILSTSHSFQSQDILDCKEGFYPSSPLGVWTRFYKSDPRIALGKYSPMEKKILRLGGIHTIAARRFLNAKYSEERKMLRELQSHSSDYKKATKDKKKPFFPYAVCGPPEKIWAAKVVVPTEDFKMPQREKESISKHVERMQLGRTRGNKPPEPSMEKFRSAQSLSEAGLGLMAKEGDEHPSDSSSNTNEEERGEAEHKSTKAQEIKMNVIFKSEEPKRCLICNSKDRKPFLPVKKLERSITGLTNRNIFPVAGFPGDLMLMTQYFLSQGLHPRDAIRTYWLQEKDTCQVQTYKAAPCLN